MTDNPNYPKVSSMPSAPIPSFTIKTIEKDVRKKNKFRIEEEVNATSSSFNFGNLIGVIVAIIIGVTVIIPTINSVLTQTNNINNNRPNRTYINSIYDFTYDNNYCCNWRNFSFSK